MKKTIGIDARMCGPEYAGIGRYTASLIANLINLKDFNQFNWLLFVRKKDLETIRNLYQDNFTYVIADFPHYSLKEQLFLPFVLYRTDCQLVHFPHFNIPILYRRPFAATIHDLIKHHSRGPETTTNYPALYQIKFFFYKLVIKNAVQKARKIFTPSQFVKDELVDHYHLKPEKVAVTYEGIENKFSIANHQFSNEKKIKILNKYQIKKPYLLYVGSVYPHKNIDRLIEAVKIARKKMPTLSLVIVCSRNVFWQRLKKKVNAIRGKKFVILTGFAPDKDLSILYQEAISFVFPSLSEGFGLPPLEAMASNCPVVSSSATCLPEIYGQAALFFDPYRPKDMAEKIIKMVYDKDLQKKYQKLGQEKIKKYSWQKMAQKTLGEYQKIISFS